MISQAVFMYLQVYLKTLERFTLSNIFLGGEYTVHGSRVLCKSYAV